ncbi:MAG: hypothetical protein KC620_10055 [Myxococcales bacterium]|nr:hypothetical protein [Myxococcales bacterium]
MRIDLLLDALASAEVEIQLEGDQLRVRAPAGRLSAGLRAELAARKGEVIAHLRGRGAVNHAASEMEQADRAPSWSGDEAQAGDPDDPLAPFPLTPIQQAYWVGRSALEAEGRVSTYGYFEIDLDALDVGRLRAALARLVARHPMLRAVVDADGEQRVVARPPPPAVPLLDLVDRTPDDRAAALAALRDEMSHQILPAETGPLYDVRVARIGPERHRLFIGVDLLTVDVSSGMILADEWVALYADPERALPTIGLTFRDYVLAERRSKADVTAAAAWWA